MREIADRLKRVCKRYNAGIENAEYLENIIIVPIKNGSLYLIFDKNCNILGIDSYDNPNYCKSKEEYFEKKYNNNPVEKEDDMCPDLMSDTFNYYSLSMIQNIYNRTYFSTKYCFYEGEMVREKNLEELISYFAFLGEEIKFYSQVELTMKKMGYDAPEIPTYLNSIMDELNYYLDFCISVNKVPNVDDFMTSIGQKDVNVNPVILRNIFDYSLRDKGYEIDYKERILKKTDKENDVDISDLSMRLVKSMK